jgi:hypothetical protein
MRRTHLLSLEPHFHAGIISGRITSAIRPAGKKQFLVGDMIQPHGWSGTPHKSKIVEVGASRRILAVIPLIGASGVMIEWEHPKGPKP